VSATAAGTAEPTRSAAGGGRPLGASFDKRGLTVLGAGHVCVDMCQGAVPALLPFFIAAHGWSYGQAAALVLAATIGSSIVQPAFGHWADRVSLPWLMPAGVTVAILGIALAGVLPTYAGVLAVIAVSGFGVGAFHPEAARYANYVSGSRRATGMSMFSLGGNIGFALGPAIVTPAVLLLGLSGTLVIAPLGLAVAAVLVRETPRLRTFQPGGGGAPGDPDAPAAWGPFSRLVGAITARSAVYFGLQTFIPLWFVAHLGTSKALGNAALIAMLVAGAIGTIFGGRLADRIGRRPVLIGSMVLQLPLLFAFLAVGPAGAIAVAALIGLVTISTFSVTVVMGQEYLPGRLGLASGVTLGLAIGIGGVWASVLGVIADRFGLTTVMDIIAVLPLVGLALALTLPRNAPGAPPPPTPRRRSGRRSVPTPRATSAAGSAT
jgi:FSR family fosmidomycin resistance protein-like MFS transporter